MEDGLTLVFAGGLAAAAAYAGLTAYLVRLGYWRLGRGPAGPRAALLMAAFFSAAWSTSVAVADLSAFTGPTYVQATLDVVRYGAWLGLCLRLLATTSDQAGKAPLVRLLGASTLGLVGIALCISAARAWHGDLDGTYTRHATTALLGLSVLGLVLTEQVYRNEHEDRRWAMKPLCLGLASMFAFDVYMSAEAVLLGRLDPDAVSVRPLVHGLAVPFAALAVRRAGDWSFGLQVSRRAVFYSAAVLMAGGYLMFIASVGYYVRYAGGEWGRALQLGLAFASVAVMVALVLSASLRARVRVFIGKHFFSYRYDYREEWLAFTTMLASDSAPREVGVRIIRAVANVLECPAGALWAKSASGSSFSQVACWNVPQTKGLLPAEDPLASFLADRAWVVDIDELRAQPEAYGGLTIPSVLEEGDRAWAIIPLSIGTDLMGWVVLDRPRAPVELDWETRDLLKTASRQAAGYLAQMIATEALLESRKFDAFNRMSAFVVHDLKNIVTQLSLMMKNARRLRDNPEFQEDMLLTVESSLEKMRRLMLQLREGATPPEGARGVELLPLAEKLRRTMESTGRRLEVLVVEPLATRGHEDRLERVLGHLVQNSMDATPPDGRVWLKVERYSGQVRVEVGDTGKGMDDEFIRTRLFKPFSSTKQHGMGIGTYESAQYIKELGGNVDVRSSPGEGTVIAILLPLLDLRRGSDLQVGATS